MPHRFFVSPDSMYEGAVFFTNAQAHQVRDVLRMRAGHEIIVLDNAENEYRVVLSECSRENVRGEIIASRPARGEPQTTIILYQALIKADKMEWVLQKGTEIGITAFVPIHTARAISDTVSKQKSARWAHILTEAAEQAGRGKIPRLEALQSLETALQHGETRGGAKFILSENERARDLKRALATAQADSFHLFIGPEGGWTEHEIALAEKFGAQSITLGPRVLRTETAGLVAASAILFARGDLGAKSSEEAAWQKM